MGFVMRKSLFQIIKRHLAQAVKMARLQSALNAGISVTKDSSMISALIAV